MVKNYVAAEDDIAVELPDYENLPRPLIEVFTCLLYTSLFILAAVQRRAEMWSGHFKFIGRGWRYKTIGSAGNDTRPIAPGRGCLLYTSRCV